MKLSTFTDHRLRRLMCLAGGPQRRATVAGRRRDVLEGTPS
ncbi:MAG TPA: hypothetical protein PLB41_00860 [Rubrivivax sp.]|nr:hypothetical protein [Rubrivivax sp.]HPO20954.1 hypothetical protein [Rubrivivax sp.]